METPHLDKAIEQLKGLAERVPVKEVTEKLQEYKAIKEALSIHSVSKSSYCDDCGDWVGGCDNEDCKYKKVDVC